MFYSQCLLSRKGPLGAVLIAAYCHSRLKKSQVLNTDIPFSIKKILDDGFPNFTYRILGYLLLGVVRIYSQKVEYVLLDCNQMLLKAKQAVTAKRTEAHEFSFLAPHQSITLPESLDLDKFIFEDIGVEHRDHVLPNEEIMLKDLWKNDEAQDFPHNGLFGEGVSIDLETFLDAGTPNHEYVYNLLLANGIVPQHQVDMPLDDTLMSDMGNLEEGIETLVQKFASQVEACDAEMVNLQADLSSCPGFSGVNYEQTTAQSLKNVEAKSSEVERELAKELYVTVVKSPERNPADGADAQQHKPLPTPAAKENVQVKRKRTCLIDEQIVLSNKAVKESIDYAGDLVRKRGRVPQTSLGVWKHGLIFNLKKNFTRPLIHCVSLDSNWCHYDDKLTSAESSPNLGASKFPEIQVLPDGKNTNKDNEMIDGLDLPVVEKDGDHIPIAPETPHQETRLKGFPLAETFERVREGSSSNTSEEEYEEMPTEVYNSSAVDFQEPDGWSASTRQAIKDLSSAFRNEHQETQQVNLDETLRGKSKRTSAKMFYDILVLKGRGMVNVQQDKPYGEILVTKCAAWETHIREEQQ